MPDIVPFDMGSVLPAQEGFTPVTPIYQGTRPPFPKAIDSTMMKTFRSCPRKFELEYLRHWKARGESIHLHAGKAFASALEETRRAFFERGLGEQDAIQAGAAKLVKEYGVFVCPPTSGKTLERMLGALDFYFEQWPLTSDPIRPWNYAPNKFAIEFSYACPLPFDNPETGEPLLYTGRSDFVGEMNGGLYIVDDKTTSALGASWVDQWDMRSQFTGYTWAAREHSNIPVQGCIVRGVSILKTKYDKAQVITYRQPWMIERWMKQTLRDLGRMAEMWQSGYFDYNLEEACNEYGGCLFRKVCLNRHGEAMLPIDYEQRVWDPLAREEKLLLEA